MVRARDEEIDWDILADPGGSVRAAPSRYWDPMPSNLLAHHLHVLEQARIITRRQSEGDRRRIAGPLYPLWAIDSVLPGMSSDRITGVAALALGFAASASAVVPGFGQLLHGNRPYLVITLFIGLAAFAAGVQMLITASGVGLAVMMAAMAVLWIIATILPTRAWSKVPRRPLRTGPCRSVLRDGSAPAC